MSEKKEISITRDTMTVSVIKRGSTERERTAQRREKKKQKETNGNMKVIYSLIFVVLHKIAVSANGDNVASDNEYGLL